MIALHITKNMQLYERTLGQWLEHWAETTPDKEYIVYSDRNLRFTWKQFNKRVDDMAKGLIAIGVERGTHVGIWAANVPDWLTLLYACAKIGAVYVTVNTNYKQAELEYLCENSDMHTLCIVNGEKDSDFVQMTYTMLPELKTCERGHLKSERFPYMKNVIYVGQEKHRGMYNTQEILLLGDNIEDTELNELKSQVDCHDVVNMQYTSGTTGFPKGVMLTQNNLASNVEAVKISAEPGTAMLSVLPIHHAFCLVMDWLKGFSQGATICINDSLLHMVRNMSIFKPDIMLMVPMMIETIYKRLSAADPQIPKAVLAEKVFGGKLQTIFTGGAHLDPYYIDRFAEYGVQILEGYGMSECSPVISNNTPENHKPGSIGRPLENVEIRFENGEILVKGTSVMKGYYQMPDETAETLKDGWLHTGDKGYMDEDGYLFINGRVKNLIILSNGENISPEEIENKLALNPLVGEVIVTGEDNGLTARIYPEQAVVEAKALDTEMIRSQLQEFLDEYNKNQPTYRRITGLVIRKNPFIRSTTKKIRRQDVLIDEPQA